MGIKNQKATKVISEKTKIADVFELPITVVNNVIYQGIRQQFSNTE